MARFLMASFPATIDTRDTGPFGEMQSDFEPDAALNSGLVPDMALDLVHLDRQTLGDADLEREVLELFLRQSGTLLQRLDLAPAGDERLLITHTLKGSARAIGAWRVADAAMEMEAETVGADLALAQLRGMVAEAQEAIGRRLATLESL